MTVKRQDIVDAVETRMKAVLTSKEPGGYYSDLGRSVIMDRPQSVTPDGGVGSAPVDPGECPCVLVRDPKDEVTPVTMSRHRHSLSVELEIRVEGGGTTREAMRKMIADVYRAIGTDPKWGGLATGTTPEGDEMVTLQGDKIIGAALIRIIIVFETTAWLES